VVVAYDEAGAGNAARLWWLLRHFGHDEAYVLDGGLRAWRELGGPLASGPEPVEPGDFAAGPPRDDVVQAEELLAAIGGEAGEPSAAGGAPPALLDARAPERFRGEHEPIDPVAGHIPGARNVPFTELSPDGRFLAREELRQRLDTGGDAVAYCGSGVSACNLVLAAEAAGLARPRLYPGSWSEWSGRGLPVERG
jgi:thiosulfate/3-mercaptopyruvate sulfurtransferase